MHSSALLALACPPSLLTLTAVVAVVAAASLLPGERLRAHVRQLIPLLTTAMRATCARPSDTSRSGLGGRLRCTRSTGKAAVSPGAALRADRRGQRRAGRLKEVVLCHLSRVHSVRRRHHRSGGAPGPSRPEAPVLIRDAQEYAVGTIDRAVPAGAEPPDGPAPPPRAGSARPAGWRGCSAPSQGRGCRRRGGRRTAPGRG